MEASNNSQGQTVPVIAPRVPPRRHVGRWLTLVAIVLVAGAVSALMIFRGNGSGNVQAAFAATVEITSHGFEPQTIKIKKGEAVTWVNKAAQPRQIVADPYPSGDSMKSLNSVDPLAEGDTYAATFEKSGTVSYHDQLDPGGVKGTIIVE